MKQENPFERRRIGMFGYAPNQNFCAARDLRSKSTEAEKLLWERLRGRKFLNFKFRRQHPVNNYILDFFCEARKLAIEINGAIHNNPEQQAADGFRTKDLNRLGIEVVRFTNAEVEKAIENVLEKIKVALLTDDEIPL